MEWRCGRGSWVVGELGAGRPGRAYQSCDSSIRANSLLTTGVLTAGAFDHASGKAGGVPEALGTLNPHGAWTQAHGERCSTGTVQNQHVPQATHYTPHQS